VCPDGTEQEIEGVTGGVGEAAQPRCHLEFSAITGEQARRQGTEIEHEGEEASKEGNQIIVRCEA
jgi:hypothetical protein